ncbi:hypothetical protein ACFPMF_26680 [Larkinella bovis]|uniref:Response regulator n=1 Tax=Larkinella bovis TaxID=683041 RepID=A0ABW0IKU8_9BACT
MTGPLSILLIGTDSLEQKTLGQAFRKYGVPHRYLAANEDSAVRGYFQKGLADALFVPTLIMLDRDTSQPETILNLLKQHPILRRIPVILYGRDKDPESVQQAYQWGATCYMPQPDNWDAVMAHFCSYWKKRVALPAITAEDILSTNLTDNQDRRQRH